MENKETNTNDPRVYTARIKEEFNHLIQYLREDIKKVDDSQAKALFEVSAEVIDGLHKAFTDYENKNEEAWTK